MRPPCRSCSVISYFPRVLLTAHKHIDLSDDICAPPPHIIIRDGGAHFFLAHAKRAQPFCFCALPESTLGNLSHARRDVLAWLPSVRVLKRVFAVCVMMFEYGPSYFAPISPSNDSIEDDPGRRRKKRVTNDREDRNGRT